MGLEANCEVEHGGRTSRGRARLEEKDLRFRGDFVLKIPFSEIVSAEARRGRLDVAFRGGKAAFALGPQAEKWVLKIRHPRGLMDKLGVKPDSRVSIIGIDEATLLKPLRERTKHVTEGKAAKGSHLIIVFMQAKTDLMKLPKLRAAIEENGAIWVVWPKGRKEFREDDVRAVAPPSGLVDVKVVSVSDTLSGLKLMIPLALRKGKS
jgi:hypothetical protein